VQRKNKDFVCPDYETLKRLGLFGDGERFNHGSRKQLFSFEEDKKALEEKDKEKK
jgi:hypothetical protein